MKQLLSDIKQYFTTTNPAVLIISILLTGLLVFVNYFFRLNETILGLPTFAAIYLSWFLIFLFAFIMPYLLYGILDGKNYIAGKKFILLLLIAPLLFAVKISITGTPCFSDTGANSLFWNKVLYWPTLVIIITAALIITWKLFNSDMPFYGMKTKGINWKPYLLMLLMMVPLIALASTQTDFQAMYPKLQSLGDVSSIPEWQKVVYELSYGSDFFTIELFFRGFLVLAFAKWAGKDAILPMACFYCTIHFGKPMAECISSFFGGLLLGIVAYNTRSIFGGLMVHVGIAWMMELFGIILPFGG